MQTRTYAELLSLIQSLSGVIFATLELGRIKALINRRALRAYRSTNYWPRFLKIGEERTVTSNVVPYTESGKSSIDTYLRIHVQAPYVTTSVQEYDIMVTADGATLVAGNTAPTSAFVTYKAQLSDTYGDETGESTSIPAEWYHYIAHGNYADYNILYKWWQTGYSQMQICRCATDELLTFKYSWSFKSWASYFWNRLSWRDTK